MNKEVLQPLGERITTSANIRCFLKTACPPYYLILVFITTKGHYFSTKTFSSTLEGFEWNLKNILIIFSSSSKIDMCSKITGLTEKYIKYINKCNITKVVKFNFIKYI